MRTGRGVDAGMSKHGQVEGCHVIRVCGRQVVGGYPAFPVHEKEDVRVNCIEVED